MSKWNRRQFVAGSVGTVAGWTIGSAAGGRAAPRTVPTCREPLEGWGPPEIAAGRDFAVATVHELATQAAKDVAKAGGNAVDAAVAASLMLAVVDGHNSGIGGGCFALIRDPKGEIHAIDGREQAGAAATPDMFLENGQPQTEKSQFGPLAAGVPGQLAALERMVRRFGSAPWESLFEPAIAVAEQGFAMGRLAGVVRAHHQDLSRFPETQRIWLPDGKLPTPDSVLRQTDLAQTLTMVARQGSESFYRGPLAKAMVEHLTAHGGILSIDDFARYQAKWRQPLTTTYRGHQVHGFPLPSSGGLHIAQMLGMLELFDLRAVNRRDPAGVYHLWLEVMQRAMADRAHWLGDADFTSVPAGLLDPDYLWRLAADIQLGTATNVAGHGLPPGAESQFFGDRHTTHLTTADRAGWVVALTQTINTSFGCKMTVPGTGFLLNNEMDDFSIAPGVANAFGLVGGHANAIAPGKRPLSSMSPTIVTRKGQPVLTCGAAGGPRIITCTLQNISRVIDLDQSIDEAIAAPRVHHQWRPAEAVFERRLPAEIVAELERRGHPLKAIQHSATAQGLQWYEHGAETWLRAAAEPRVGGVAAAETLAR